MTKDKLKNIIKSETKLIFERVFATPLWGGGATSSPQVDFQFGYEGFNTMPDHIRSEIANNKLNQLISQYNGDEERAIEELPDYMALYI